MMDQLGFLTWCSGSSSVVMPLARDPYFYPRRDRPEEEDDEEAEETAKGGARKGPYYHPKKFELISYDDLLDETRPRGYAFPCPFKACRRFKTVLSVQDSPVQWNRFRRMHDALCKNIELKELRESKVPIHQALFDMFSRNDSSRLAWTEHIPKEPLYAFNVR